MMARIEGATIVRWVFACAAVTIVALLIADAWLTALVVASVLLAVAVFGPSTK